MEPVEKYKLTKEQIAWSKGYSKMLKVAKLLDSGMLHHMNRAKGFSDLLRLTEEKLQELVQAAPSHPTHLLPEQPPPQDEPLSGSGTGGDLQINY